MPGILVVAEHLNGALHDITGEMIGAAAELKEALSAPLMVAVIGDVDGVLAEAANLEGVDEVLRTLGRAVAFRALGHPYLVLTSHGPIPGTQPARLLADAAPGLLHDVLVRFDPAAVARLARYGAGEGVS